VEFVVGEPCPFKACISCVCNSGLNGLAGIEHESYIAILVLAEISTFALLFLPQWLSTLGTVDQTKSSCNELVEAIKDIISELEISFTPSCGNKLTYYISARGNSGRIGSELSARTICIVSEIMACWPFPIMLRLILEHCRSTSEKDTRNIELPGACGTLIKQLKAFYC
jgi:hypothetical protein